MMNSRLFISILLNLALGYWYYSCLPPQLFNASHSTVLLDREGELLSARISEDQQWRFPEMDSLPKKFSICLTAFEDRNFHQHSGVHLPSIFRAFIQNIQAGKVVSGGSTITMQTVRLMKNNPKRTLWEKLKEVILASRLEWRLTKEEILCKWASHAPFGGNVVGLEAASWRYFQRSPKNLSWGEAALLAVLPNAPSLIYPGKNQELLKAKRNRLIDYLVSEGVITYENGELAKSESIPDAPLALKQKALHLLQTLEKRHGNGKTYESTIDPALQHHCKTVLEKHARALASNEVYNLCAMVVRVDDRSVAAYVGNVEGSERNPSPYPDLIQAPRSTGSILKPLLYAAMLSDGELLPEMLVDDIPVRIGSFAPTNYSEDYDGVVPASSALARSLNIPAVHLLEKYSVESFHHKLKKLEFRHINYSPSHYGLSLILGGAEASPWDVASAYTGICRDLKHFRELNSKYSIDDNNLQILKSSNLSEKVTSYSEISAGSVYLTFKALLEVNRPESEEGWKLFNSSVPVAWKTGTSYGFRDAWTIGCTPGHVIVVWVGNAQGEGRPGLTGVNTAAPVMFEILDFLPHSGWFETPFDDFDEEVVCSQSGFLAGSNCSSIDTILVPMVDRKTEVCPYHKRVFLHRENGKRVDASCFPLEDIYDTSWFELRPVQSWFYRQKNAQYKPLPAWHENCEKPSEPLDIIYPKNGQQIFLPRIDSTNRNELVLEVAHNDPESTLYWHLDREFIGKTNQIHKVNCSPGAGKHRITIVDQDGNLLESEFEILDQI